MQGDDVAKPRVSGSADARDRIEGGGLDLAVVEETIADVRKKVEALTARFPLYAWKRETVQT